MIKQSGLLAGSDAHRVFWPGDLAGVKMLCDSTSFFPILGFGVSVAGAASLANIHP